MTAMADDQRRRRHDLRVGEPVDEQAVGGTSIGSSGWWPFVVARTRTGSSASPSKQPGSGRSPGPARCSAHEDERLIAARQLDVGVGELELQRAGHDRLGRPARGGTRVAGRCRRATSRSLMPPWKRSCGGRPIRARVSLNSRRPSRSPDSRSAAPPATPSGRAPSAAGRAPDAEERHSGVVDRIEVGDQRRPRDPMELGGQRRSEREDVADDDVGIELLEQRQLASAASPAPGGSRAVGEGRRRTARPPRTAGRGPRSAPATGPTSPR